MQGPITIDSCHMSYEFLGKNVNCRPLCMSVKNMPGVAERNCSYNSKISHSLSYKEVDTLKFVA